MWWCLKFTLNSRNMRTKQNSKNLRSRNLHPKRDSTMICFWASLSMINFEHLSLIVYIWVFNTTIEVFMKRTSNSNNTLLLERNKKKNYANIQIPAWRWTRWPSVDHGIPWCNMGFMPPYFATTFRLSTKNIMALIYWSIFLVHFTILAPTHVNIL